jgi:hypothetical protein
MQQQVEPVLKLRFKVQVTQIQAAPPQRGLAVVHPSTVTWVYVRFVMYMVHFPSSDLCSEDEGQSVSLPRPCIAFSPAAPRRAAREGGGNEETLAKLNEGQMPMHHFLLLGRCLQPETSGDENLGFLREAGTGK